MYNDEDEITLIWTSAGNASATKAKNRSTSNYNSVYSTHHSTKL